MKKYLLFSLFILPSLLLAVDTVWKVDTDGKWSNPNNWSAGVPYYPDGPSPRFNDGFTKDTHVIVDGTHEISGMSVWDRVTIRSFFQAIRRIPES